MNTWRGGRVQPTAASALQQSYFLTHITHTPQSMKAGATAPRKLDHTDAVWLRWVLLSICVLVCQTLLLVSGYFEPLNAAHVSLLQGAPFYLSEQAVQQGSVLSMELSFAYSLVLVLYGAAVLMYQRSFGSRCLLAALAMVAVALPGMLCALADCVLYVVPQLFCIAATWLLVACIPFFRFDRA